MSKKKPPGGPYEVGYKKPPKHTQFAANTSGNPKGRPKGSLNLATALNRALAETMPVIVNNRRVRMTKLDVSIKGLVNRAVRGDPKAMQQMLALAPLVGINPTTTSQTLDANDAAILKDLMQRMADGGEPSDKDS
jgi:hypothetical protein